MPIDRKLFKNLQDEFKYFEDYDRLHGKPDKRVQLCITIPLKLKKKLEKNLNQKVQNRKYLKK